MSSTRTAAPNEAKAEARNIQKAKERYSRSSKVPVPDVQRRCFVLPLACLLVHELLVVGGIDDVVGEVDQELSKTALSGCVISKNRGEGGITERLW